MKKLLLFLTLLAFLAGPIAPVSEAQAASHSKNHSAKSKASKSKLKAKSKAKKAALKSSKKGIKAGKRTKLSKRAKMQRH